MSPEPANLFELRPLPAKLGLAVLLVAPLGWLAAAMGVVFRSPILAFLIWGAIGYVIAAWIFQPALQASGWRAAFRRNLRIAAILLVALNALLVYQYVIALRTLA